MEEPTNFESVQSLGPSSHETNNNVIYDAEKKSMRSFSLCMATNSLLACLRVAIILAPAARSSGHLVCGKSNSYRTSEESASQSLPIAPLYTPYPPLLFRRLIYLLPQNTHNSSLVALQDVAQSHLKTQCRFPSPLQDVGFQRSPRHRAAMGGA